MDYYITIYLNYYKLYIVIKLSIYLIILCQRDTWALGTITNANVCDTVLYCIFSNYKIRFVDNPLNLSISLRGGKENNDDFLSSGERKGNSPNVNPLLVEL
jgi:hypothetical protein